jgi:N6-L-threonylcarbamoyladenine synthase
MHILGIETSCDETAAAIIEGKGEHVFLQSNVLATSLALHAKTGGIIPEQAAREQVKYILPVIKDALEKAHMRPEQLDAIAVTYGPGLIGSLLVGVETAKTFAYVLNKPIIPVNHMIGHIYANWITIHNNTPPQPIPFPLLALVVSGGHTDLLLMKRHGDFQLLGGTRDDAAGECFDKCARLLGYPYPGGPQIARLAEKGNSQAFPFPRPMIGSHTAEFSFSGLKTAFLNATKEHFPTLRTGKPSDKIGWQQIMTDETLSSNKKQTIYDLCASLQQAITDVLVKKTIKAAKKHNVKSILLSGGVSANDNLKQQFALQAKKIQTNLFFPPQTLSTDNAAMIASAAYYSNNPVPWKEITADPELYFG